MGKTKPNTNIFSPEQFGKSLRMMRHLAGFSNTRSFSEAIKGCTGESINFEVLMRYERGECEPDLTNLIAISMTIAIAHKKNFSNYLLSLVLDSMPLDGLFLGDDLEAKAAREFIQYYRAKFKKDPSVNLIEKATDSFVDIENLPISTEEKKLVKIYRNESQSYKDLCDSWNFEVIPIQDTPPDKGVNDK